MELNKESLSSIQFKIKGGKYYYAEEVDKVIDDIIGLVDHQKADAERLRQLEEDSSLRSSMSIQEETILKEELERLQAKEKEWNNPDQQNLYSMEDTRKLQEIEQKFVQYKEKVEQQNRARDAEYARLQQVSREYDQKRSALADAMVEVRMHAQTILREAEAKANTLMENAEKESRALIEKAESQSRYLMENAEKDVKTRVESYNFEIERLQNDIAQLEQQKQTALLDLQSKISAMLGIQ